LREWIGHDWRAVAPNTNPHPKAPDAFPDIPPQTISHPDFRPILQAAVDLDIAARGPGSYMVGGISDYTETFVLTHIFVQQPATVASHGL